MNNNNKKKEKIKKQLSGMITWYGMTEKQKQSAVNKVFRDQQKKRKRTNNLPTTNKSSIIKYLASRSKNNYNQLLNHLRVKGLLRNLSESNLKSLKLNTNILRNNMKVTLSKISPNIKVRRSG